MAFYLDDYIRAIREKLREVAESEELTDRQIRDCVEDAARHHSSFKPNLKIADIPGKDSYDIDVPADWIVGFSQPTRVEYPQGNRIPTYLEPKDYLVYQGPTGNPVLRLLSTQSATGENLRLTYIVPHSITESVTTIPDSDFWALVNLAAAKAAENLAARYTRVWDPTLGIDLVNYGTKAASYLELARRFATAWRDHLGLPAGPQAAFAYGDWDIRFSWDRDLLVHKPRYR